MQKHILLYMFAILLLNGCQSALPTPTRVPISSQIPTGTSIPISPAVTSSLSVTTTPNFQPGGSLPIPTTSAKPFHLVSIERETESWELQYDATTSRWVPSAQSQAQTWATQTKIHYERHGIIDGKAFAYTVVTDGQTVWSYRPLENLLTIHSDRSYDLEQAKFYAFGASDMSELFKNLSRCFDAKYVADEIVAERPAYRIEIGPDKCAKGSDTSDDGPRTVWFDQETFFPLREELYSLDRQQVVSHYQVLSVRYNPQLPDSYFTFVPPPNVTIQDERPQPSRTPNK